jgi:hypothetical protein
MEFELTNPKFERAKIVHALDALDRAATVIYFSVCTSILLKTANTQH